MNKDKFVERVVGILSDRLEEGLVKAQNKAAKKSWEAEQGKKKFAAKVGETPREKQAAQKGGKGGGAEAMKRGVQASYRATHREVASHDPKVNFINRVVNNISETHGERVGAAAKAMELKKDKRRMAARDVIKSAPPKQAPKKEEASNDPKVNFINRTVDSLVERLVGKQKKLDVNKSGKLDAQDFKMLRKGKGK